jgi:DNA-binding PadR family transcriptional regulator
MQAAAHRKNGATHRAISAAAFAPLPAAGQAAKTLMVLGLLKSGPKHGYELHRIVVAHGTLYSDFKKPTLYHLLHRLALQGAVQVRSEDGARGPRGQRLVFALTAKGEALFMRLLRSALSSYDLAQTSFEVAAAFLALLPAVEAQALLRKRREAVRARRAEVIAEAELLAAQPYSARLAARRLAADHALGLMDAEVAWIERAIRHLAGSGSRKNAPGLKLRRAVGE